jgi:hypothetical protein
MKMEPVEYTQGCSDGGCCLRIGPVGQHTNGGCHCLRDLPTELRIKIMRKFAHERARLAELERERDEAKSKAGDVWIASVSRVQDWRVSLVSPTDDDPFRKVECKIVDIGFADKVVVIEAAKGGRDEN